VTDFDVEEDVNCRFPPCCTHNWLSLPQGGGQDTKQYCGLNRPPSVVTVSQVKTNIKFHTSKVVIGGRGFQLNYTVIVGEYVTWYKPSCLKWIEISKFKSVLVMEMYTHIF
jgi:hypothetical protein